MYTYSAAACWYTVRREKKNTHPVEETGQVGEPARGHELEDDGEHVSLAPLGGRLELHHERLALGGEGELAGRDHHGAPVVREGDTAQGRRRVLLLELLEDRAELGRRLTRHRH